MTIHSERFVATAAYQQSITKYGWKPFSYLDATTVMIKFADESIQVTEPAIRFKQTTVNNNKLRSDNDKANKTVAYAAITGTPLNPNARPFRPSETLSSAGNNASTSDHQQPQIRSTMRNQNQSQLRHHHHHHHPHHHQHQPHPISLNRMLNLHQHKNLQITDDAWRMLEANASLFEAYPCPLRSAFDRQPIIDCASQQTSLDRTITLEQYFIQLAKQVCNGKQLYSFAASNVVVIDAKACAQMLHEMRQMLKPDNFVLEKRLRANGLRYDVIQHRILPNDGGGGETRGCRCGWTSRISSGSTMSSSSSSSSSSTSFSFSSSASSSPSTPPSSSTSSPLSLSPQ